jgi:hypothetical protein
MAWLGLAYFGLAWLGPWPEAGPCTALFPKEMLYQEHLSAAGPSTEVRVLLDFF